MSAHRLEESESSHKNVAQDYDVSLRSDQFVEMFAEEGIKGPYR